MKLQWLIVALVFLLKTVDGPTTAQAQDGFQPLFNGTDLAGWTGNPELWSVEDGCITGRTKSADQLTHNQFLIWEGTVDDFELKCEFRLEGDNNSGVQYRSVHAKDQGEFVCIGYQADIHASRNYTGMMYDEKGRGILATRGQKVILHADGRKEVSELKSGRDIFDLTKWHELTITARGNHLVHQVDGVTMMELIDEQEAERELSGVLGLQIHRGPAMVCQFRNLRLKKLTAADAAPPAAATAPPMKEAAGATVTGNGSKQRKNRNSRKTAETAAVNPQWIWLSNGDQPADKVFFRKEIDSSGVGAARLFAACDDVMRIYVDGKLVAESDSWENPVFVDLSKALDLDDPVKQHVLAIEGENGKGAAGLVVRIDFESGWREAWSTVSDIGWQAATKADGDWKLAAYKPSADWKAAEIVAPLGEGPWKDKVTAATLIAAAPLKQPEATPAESLKIAKGFRAELLYSVPKDQEGSWVNLCVDPKGRLIVSDQYGSLYRVTPPAPGTDAPPDSTLVEKIDVAIGEAQGLLWAFDSLYVSVNRGQKFRGGLYRVRDTDNDDKLDSVEPLRYLEGAGEHGPHAVLPHPDGKSLVIVCGNGTELTELADSRLPPTWDEDLLLPRVKGRFMLGKRAPGGCIYKIDPNGKQWELIASGFRNEFDAAFSSEGELFTYDADMEWDINAPWYRPTRICHAVSAAEFGWRSSSGKWPVHYADSVPPVVNIGPGSPTGVCFGYGANFPAHYQNALFAADWSYGKLYAVHLKPRGATYTADLEDFVSGTPLPLTDVIVNPHDGAMYFTIGGRKVQSGLYRVTYTADSANSARNNASWLSEASVRQTRRSLEIAHRPGAELTVDALWPHLASTDRAIRYAARVALEHKPVAEWQERALTETNPQASLTALMALARTYRRQDKGVEPDIDSPIVDWETFLPDPARAALTSRILKAINQLGVTALDQQMQLDALRVITLTFVRISPPNGAERAAIAEQLRTRIPAPSPELTSELAQLAVYVQAPWAADTLLPLLETAPTQEEQIDIAKSLRHLKVGWSLPLYERYFQWYVRAATYRGGASFSLYLNNMKADAVANLSAADLTALQPVLDAKPVSETPVFSAAPRAFVREWTMAELVPLVDQGMQHRDFDHGRQMFAAASCFACHRFDNQGGAVGPDLTLLSGRFSARDLLESIVEPSKVISDQYASHQFLMLDGRVINGRIINLAGDAFRVQTNMLDPGALVGVDRKQIDEMTESRISMMPTGLLNTMNEREVLDLFAYLLSRGDRTNAVFAK